MGTALSMPSAVEVIDRAVKAVRARGGTLPVDPNLRRELRLDAATEDRFARLVSAADLLLPSGEELERAAGVEGEAAAPDRLFGRGVREIVLKRGAAGATVLGRLRPCRRAGGPAGGGVRQPRGDPLRPDPRRRAERASRRRAAIRLRGAFHRYQGEAALRALVRDGFRILKVGPELTFVLREALHALDRIAAGIVPGYGDRPLRAEMEALMLAEPGHWRRHYPGPAGEQRILRHESLLDRIRYYWIRYYWPHPRAAAAVERLTAALAGRILPREAFARHLPGAEGFAGAPLAPQEVLVWRVTQSLETCHRAGQAPAGPEPTNGRTTMTTFAGKVAAITGAAWGSALPRPRR